MKKKVLQIIILGLLLSFAAWYGYGPGLLHLAEKSMPDSWKLEPDIFGKLSPCGVNMTVSILPENKLEISISNETEMFLSSGLGATIQIQKHGRWFTIRSAMEDPINLDTIELAPSETGTLPGPPITLLSSSEDFPAGQYRAIKQITLLSEGNKEVQVVYAACEFTVRK